ncbi:hypothetical protein Vadar_004318 [Vaccinium darrowii]|uniref:Uncharacterized protein n=1 Tax=Vaccinium darrowii TaxID=229202 RepID=A0ACB7XFA7_9ERIC|nr:hypothetical protein Vadar_004318 [Vaccinium darrowii]
MLQSFVCSSILPVKSSLLNQGYVTQLQLPVKRIQNYKHKHSLWNTESKRKTLVIRSKLLGSHPSESKKEHVVGQIQREIFKKWDIFYRFMRPYSVLGTVRTSAVVPTILLNIYWNGLNQLFDVEIDKVNKPYLPIASGEISTEFGIALTSMLLLMSFTMGIMFQSPPLLYGLLALFVVTSAYSIELPLLRWKGNPFLAAFTLMTIRGLAIPPAFFMHIQKYVLGRPFVLTRSLVFAVAIFSLLSITCAIIKDVPDVDGDREHGVQTLSVILGKEKAFWVGISLLLSGYGSAMVVGASSSCFTNKLVTVLGHGALASLLWLRACSIDFERKESM